VTGSPAGNNVPAYPCASWSVTIVLPSLVALRVWASTVYRMVPCARRQGLVLYGPTILAPRPGVLSSRAMVGYVHPWGVRHARTYKRSHARTKPRGDRAHERDSQSTCEPAYERLAALLPGRRSVLPPGWCEDGSPGRVRGRPCALASAVRRLGPRSAVVWLPPPWATSRLTHRSSVRR